MKYPKKLILGLVWSLEYQYISFGKMAIKKASNIWSSDIRLRDQFSTIWATSTGQKEAEETSQFYRTSSPKPHQGTLTLILTQSNLFNVFCCSFFPLNLLRTNRVSSFFSAVPWSCRQDIKVSKPTIVTSVRSRDHHGQRQRLQSKNPAVCFRLCQPFVGIGVGSNLRNKKHRPENLAGTLQPTPERKITAPLGCSLSRGPNRKSSTSAGCDVTKEKLQGLVGYVRPSLPHRVRWRRLWLQQRPSSGRQATRAAQAVRSTQSAQAAQSAERPTAGNGARVSDQKFPNFNPCAADSTAMNILENQNELRYVSV